MNKLAWVLIGNNEYSQEYYLEENILTLKLRKGTKIVYSDSISNFNKKDLVVMASWFSVKIQEKVGIKLSAKEVYINIKGLEKAL